MSITTIPMGTVTFTDPAGMNHTAMVEAHARGRQGPGRTDRIFIGFAGDSDACSVFSENTHENRAMVRQHLNDLGLPRVKTFSRKAGCGCGCSPGFLCETKGQTDFYVTFTF